MSTSNIDKNQLVLGYWTMRGFAEPIRLALHYSNTPYTEKLYEQGKGQEFSREEWLSEKQNLGLDFPNLPYLFDGDLKMTQSKAILYYIGRKINLMGKTPTEEAHVMMLCEQAHDFRLKTYEVFYGPEGTTKERRKNFADKVISEELKKFDDYFGKHKTKFAVGDHPTVADFQLYEYIDAGLAIDEEHTLIDKLPNIKQFMKTIRELPRVGDYITRAHAQLPLNAKMAEFAGQVLEQK
ncbi:unnamed protein product [Adineta steineri]|uniref:glutathione transferase n=1 Tax=Adineta steineri TaxID=433720 RepID=A0A814WT16_9BILA|nr:unnamed protein product [Adineta steineri]CAF1316203.1 unnamed protein product [Adineta steineri]CAF3556922.1 unnamed protein product [Adineta steineri]CAF3567993.1 unnamed protein product [Adineta steineri]